MGAKSSKELGNIYAIKLARKLENVLKKSIQELGKEVCKIVAWNQSRKYAKSSNELSKNVGKKLEIKFSLNQGFKFG